MLKGIPDIISPELLKVLCEMGHSDRIVIADGNSPTESVGKNAKVIRCDGHGVQELLEAILPYLHICWDTGHANVEDLDQYNEIIAMGKELRAVHIHDNFGNADSHFMPLVGTTNFDRIMNAFIEIDFKGNFTFEASNTIRFPNTWPHNRTFQSGNDKISTPPLFIQQKQISVMHDIGKWMLESYGITVE